MCLVVVLNGFICLSVVSSICCLSVFVFVLWLVCCMCCVSFGVVDVLCVEFVLFVIGFF